MLAKLALGSAKKDQLKRATINIHQNQKHIVARADKEIIQVLGISQKVSGCGWHRVLLPLAFLPDSYNHVCNVPTEEVLKERDFDIFLFNRFSPFDQNWDEVKKHYKVVMDMDDDWDLPYNHPLHKFYAPQRERVINNIAQADLITCTNDRLAQKLRKYHNKVVILPNCIPLGQHQYTEDKNPSDKVRIFWGGGSTHMDDIKLLRGPVKRLHHFDNIEMVLGGYTDSDQISKEYWDKLWSMFTDGGRLPNKKLASTLPNAYMSHFEEADIMLIPLQESDWHACKSNLKILEAASKRVPCIVSKVEPYSVDADAPVLWVENQKDWYKHLTYLINNPDERINMGNDLFEWAKSKYNYEHISKLRREAYADLIKA